MANRLALCLLTTALVALAAIPTATAQEAEACGAPLQVHDARDDQVMYPVVPAPDAVRQAELDLLGTSIAIEGDEVVLTATLGAVPTGDGTYSYRYWFGFHVKPAGGAPEYMDIRMHGKDDLAGASLITSNEQGLERIAEVAPQWNGTTATFRFALALLHEVYGTSDLQVGQPRSSTDGPFNQESLMWFPTGVAYQVDHAPDAASDWTAYEPCPPVAAPEAQPSPAVPAEVVVQPRPVAAQHAEAPAPDNEEAPGLGPIGVLVAVGLALLACRKRT